jgi:hypothetical protein
MQPVAEPQRIDAKQSSLRDKDTPR